jgi:hypothetical protein
VLSEKEKRHCEFLTGDWELWGCWLTGSWPFTCACQIVDVCLSRVDVHLAGYTWPGWSRGARWQQKECQRETLRHFDLWFKQRCGGRWVRYYDTKKRQNDPGISHRQAGIKEDEKVAEIKIGLHGGDHQWKILYRVSKVLHRPDGLNFFWISTEFIESISQLVEDVQSTFRKSWEFEQLVGSLRSSSAFGIIMKDVETAVEHARIRMEIVWGNDRLSLNMDNPAITNLINKFSLNHSILMNIHNSLESLHFHVALSWIQTKNCWLWLDRILRTSNCSEMWLSRYGYSLWTRRFWDSADLDSVLDCLSERETATCVDCLWIKFTLDTNWIASIVIFITLINLDSKQCWNSWIKMFLIL